MKEVIQQFVAGVKDEELQAYLQFVYLKSRRTEPDRLDDALRQPIMLQSLKRQKRR